MGLFDKRDKKVSKKAGDEFDSPVEKIDLNAPEPAAEPAPSPAPAAQAPASPGKLAAKEPPAPEPEEYDSSFGIDKAIELMRTLPADNIELVVQVVKLTLESTKIKISTIIDDATRKQDDIQGRIKVLKGEIAEFENEIATRKTEISGLEADFDETSTVKERLILAEKLTKKPAAPQKVTSGKIPADKPEGPGDKPTTPPSGPTSTSPLGDKGPTPSVIVKK
jgi:hypothetical protein